MAETYRNTILIREICTIRESTRHPSLSVRAVVIFQGLAIRGETQTRKFPRGCSSKASASGLAGGLCGRQTTYSHAPRSTHYDDP